MDSFRRTTNRGSKVPGWEEFNVKAIAHALKLDEKYVRCSLTGRRNCTVDVLKRAGRLLGMTLSDVAARIENAQHIYKIRASIDRRRKRY